MQESLYQTLQEVLQVLKVVTSELHARHPEVTTESGGKECREASCLALSRLEAQFDTLRRSMGVASFRSRF